MAFLLLPIFAVDGFKMMIIMSQTQKGAGDHLDTDQRCFQEESYTQYNIYEIDLTFLPCIKSMLGE